MNTTELERRMRHATITLAMMRSKSAVKDAIRRQGTRKLSQVPSAEITCMAKVEHCCADCPTLPIGNGST